MADTYTLISSVTVGAGGASSIDFTSIPSTYTDLLVKVSGRSNASQVYDVTCVKFNNTATNLSSRVLGGTGSAANSITDTNGRYGVIDGNTSTTNTFSNIEIYVPNYAGSTYKSFSSDSVMENNATEAYTNLTAGLWSASSAINQVTFTLVTGSFMQYSTAYLYGIKNS